MKSVLPFVLAAVAAAGALPAQAQESPAPFTVRIPVAAETHAPLTVKHDFGSALVGATPSAVFKFTNRGSTPTTVGAITAIGAARLLSHTCQTALAPYASCEIELGVAVDTTGPNKGAVTVSHSGAQAPDIFDLSATGVTTSATLRFDEQLVNFGAHSIRVAGPLRTLTLRNTGEDSVEVASVSLPTTARSYTLVENNCEGVLAAGSSCQVMVRFTPLSLGTLNSPLNVWLADGGSAMLGAMLSGLGVQGVPSWSSTELTFLEAAVGGPAQVKDVALTNAGQGVLYIQGLSLGAAAAGTSFKIESTTCASSLAPAQSCTVRVSFTALSSAPVSTVLQLNAQGTLTTQSRIQLVARPAEAQALLTARPVSLSFGAQAVGSSETLDLELASTGQLAVGVSAYSLSGANSADFTILNPAECIGTLAPGAQCVVKVQATPTGSGPRTASLVLSSQASQPVPPVPLSVQGVLGRLEASPALLTFPGTQVGQKTSLAVELLNTGDAALHLEGLAVTGTGANQYSVSSACGASLAAGARCTVSVEFAPSSAASHSATLTVKNTGSAPTVPVQLAGTGTAAPVAAVTLGDFTCPAPAQKGVQLTCNAVLANPGQVPVTYSGAGSSSNPLFTPALTGCAGSLAPGASCTVSLRATVGASGTVSTVYQLVTSAQTVSKAVSVNVEAPRGALTLSSHGAVELNQFKDSVHTLSNTGNFALSLTLPATLGSGSSSAYTVRTSTCPTSLPVGASCTITTRCAPTLAGALTGSLAVASNAEPTLTGALSCSGTAPAASVAGMQFTPNPADFGATGVGAAQVTRTVTLANTNPAGSTPVGLGAFTFSGAQGGDFALVSRGTCGTSLAPGASCTFTLGATASASGVRSAILTLATALAQGNPTLPLSVLGVVPSFTVSPASNDFGAVLPGASGSRTVTVTNTGAVAAQISRVTASATNSSLFVYGGTCAQGLSLAAGQSCTSVMSLNTSATSLRGAQSASLAFAVVGNSGEQSASFTATVNEPLSAKGTVALSCPATAAASQTITCTATVASTGTAALNVSSWGLTRKQGTTVTTFSTPTTVCSGGATLANVIPGQTCSASVTFSTATLSAVTVTAAPVSNATLTAANSTVQVLGPSLSLSTTAHPTTQLGTQTTVGHVLTNTGPSTVTLSGATSSTPAITVDRSACTTLESGKSCTLTTTCKPTTAGTLTANLTVSGSPTVSTGASVSCVGQTALLSASALPNGNQRVGGYTLSGDWIRVTNGGAGPVAIQGLVPATGWTLFASSADATHCSVGAVVQPGQSCLVLQLLNGTQGPGLAVTGSHAVRGSGANAIWKAADVVTEGLAFAPVSDFAPVQVGGVTTATYRLTNQAAWPLATPVALAPSSTSLSVVSHNCPASLSAGASCDLNLRYTAPMVTTPAVLYLRATAGYPAVINNVVQSGTPIQGVQGTLSLSFTAQPAKVTVQVGTNAPINPGQTATLTHTVRNEGVGPVLLTAAPTITVSSQYSISGGTCASGATLAAGASCTVDVLFKPLSGTASAVVLGVPTSVGTVNTSFTGAVIPQVDIGLTFTGADVVFKDEVTAYKLTVSNNPGPAVTVLVNFGLTAQDGAQSTLAQLQGGICGTWVFSSGGTATQTVAGWSSPAAGSCTVNPSLRQLQLNLPANMGYTATLTASSGDRTGSYLLSGSASAQAANDTNPTNNTATRSVYVSSLEAWDADSAELPCSNFGFDNQNRILCNNFGISKWRAAGRVDINSTAFKEYPSLWYLTAPGNWDIALGKSTYRYPDSTFPDISLPWLYYNEQPRTGYWDHQKSFGGNSLNGTSDGTIYLYHEFYKSRTNYPATYQYRSKMNVFAAFNPDGTVKYVRQVAFVNADGYLQLEEAVGTGFDPVRGVAYAPGTTSTGTYIHQIRLSDGAILKTWPYQKFGDRMFIYDRGTGDLYFARYEKGQYGRLRALVRVNPETEQATEIAIPLTENVDIQSGTGVVAYNGVIYFTSNKPTISIHALYELDLNKSPITKKKVAEKFHTSGGRTNVNIMWGGPNDPYFYAPNSGVRVKYR